MNFHSKTSISFFLLGILFLPSLTACAQQGRIIRKDCGVSFVTPERFEYIEIENPDLKDDAACIIAFNKNPPSKDIMTAGQTEGWRENVDYVIQVDRRSIDSTLRDYSLIRDARGNYRLNASKTADSSLKMELESTDPFEIVNGSGVIAEIDATNPPPSMTRRDVKGQVVFVVGNESTSTSYALWPSASKAGSQGELEAMTILFKSFEILEK